MEELVNHEQAAMLKHLGFNYNCGHYLQFLNGESEDCYRDYLDNWNNKESNFYILISRPSLHLCAQWLRKVKGLHVAVNLTHDGWYWQIISTITAGCFAEQSFIDTHDLALSAGITKALELLQTKSSK